jgi:hypothetical protein
MKPFLSLREYLKKKPTSWWLIFFVFTLNIAVLYRLVLTSFRMTDTLLLADVIVCAVFWLVLQLVSLPIVKRLFSDGMAYALAKALVLVTNPMSVALVFFAASLFRFTDFTSTLERLLYGIPTNSLDWLGGVEVLLLVSVVFLLACLLRGIYLVRTQIPWRRLRPLVAALFMTIVLVASYYFIPTAADRTLKTHLKPRQYSIADKQPMWSCCMIRRVSSEFSATDVYYKVSAGKKTHYFRVSDTSSYRGLENGSQIWKATEIDKQSYEIAIKPW